MVRVNPGRPAAAEYIPYYDQYIRRVPDGDIVDILERQLEATTASATSISPEQAQRRAAPEGWNAIEVVGHLADTERVLAYRALRIARGDPTPLAGVADFEPYLAMGGFALRPLPDVVDEFASVRRATITLLRSLDAEAWSRSGTADGQRISVRALAYICAGHEGQHLEALRDGSTQSRAPRGGGRPTGG